MRFYFTLKEECPEEKERVECNKVLTNLGYKTSYLGGYISRDYITIIFDIEAVDLDDKHSIDLIEKNIKAKCNILEMDIYMKFYYILEKRYLLKQTNLKVSNLLKKEGYTFRIYNSHSNNGILYVGLNIFNIDPLRENEIEVFTNKINKIEGVNEVIIY